jgi:hypothetical protein
VNTHACVVLALCRVPPSVPAIPRHLEPPRAARDESREEPREGTRVVRGALLARTLQHTS